MSSTIIDAPDAGSTASAAPDVETHSHLPIRRAWLVAVAIIAVATLGLSLAWQGAGASAPSGQASTTPVAPTAPAVPASSVGAGVLALAWELTPPSQRDAACTQFTAGPDAAWAAYSGAAQDVATRAEFTAFFRAAC